MMDIATMKLLQGIVRRESRSLLQYIGESYPWTTAKDSETLAKIQQLIREEQDAAVGLANTLAKRHQRLPPYLGPYPMSFTSINYVTLAYLVPLLIDYEKQGIADLERDVVQIADEELAGKVQEILEMKRRHLQVLIDLGGSEK